LSREKIAMYLWPEADQERARRHLTDALYALRHVLGRDATAGSGDELWLNGGLLDVDLWRFREELAESAPGPAVEHYGGAFLDCFFVSDPPEFERWAVGERSQLERQYGQALERLAEAREAAGDARGAVEWWRRLIQLDPLCSRATLRLMYALEAAGGRADPARASEGASVRFSTITPPTRSARPTRS
jgi:DNA-binding SARP family transcriptional activator